MSPAHSRRRDLRRPCRRRDAATTVDLSDLQELVAAEAAKLVRKLNDPAVGEDDLRQEFLVRLHQGMANYDPALGDRLQFAKVLIKRHRVSLTRGRYAEKRQAATTSLNQPVVGEEGETTLGATLSHDNRLLELGLACRTEVEQADLRMGLQSVMDKLSADERKLAELLMDSDSVSEAARESGIPRTTLNYQIRALRTPFQQGGMKEFLD